MIPSGSNDDWVVKFKIDTKEVDAALKKVKLLKDATTALYTPSSVKVKGSGSSSATKPNENKMLKKIAVHRYRQHLKEQREINKQEINAKKQAEKEKNAELKKMEVQRLAKEKADARRLIADEKERRRSLKKQAKERYQTHIQEVESNRRALEGMAKARYNTHMREVKRQASIQRRSTERSPRWQNMPIEEAHILALAENNRRDALPQRGVAKTPSGGSTAGFDKGLSNLMVTRDNMLNRIRNSTVLDEGDRRSLSKRVRGINSMFASASNMDDVEKIRFHLRAISGEISNAVGEQRRLNHEFGVGKFATSSMAQSMSSYAKGFLSIYAVGSVFGSMYQNAKDMENLSVSTLMAAGNQKAADAVTEKIRARALETGLSLKSVQEMYNKVIVSAKDANLDQNIQDKIFEGITTLQIGYGLDKEQQKFVGKAFAQMFGKQKVRAEEFTQQLGEHMPSIISTMVEAAGLKSPDELYKKMQEGKLGIPELLKFIELLRVKAVKSGAYGKGINTMEASEQRMHTGWIMFSEQFIGMLRPTIIGMFDDITAHLLEIAGGIKDEIANRVKTGLVGKWETTVDLIIESFKSVIETVDLFGEVLFDLLKKLNIIKTDLGLKDWLTKREQEALYFQAKGAKTEEDKQKLRDLGMPAYIPFIANKLSDMGVADPWGMAQKVAALSGVTDTKAITGADYVNQYLDKKNAQGNVVGNFFRDTFARPNSYFMKSAFNESGQLDTSRSILSSMMLNNALNEMQAQTYKKGAYLQSNYALPFGMETSSNADIERYLFENRKNRYIYPLSPSDTNTNKNVTPTINIYGATSPQDSADAVGKVLTDLLSGSFY